MAAQDISIARAVFISALLRPEPGAPEISRDDATLFARAILRTCNVCTSSNIKLCKSFIITFIIPSEARIAALAKYLVTLSKSFGPRDLEVRVDTTKPGDENEGLGKIVNGEVQQPPEPAFKRLHILYILHDVLTHVHVHLKTSTDDVWESARRTLEMLLRDLQSLAELAVCACDGKSAKTYPMVMDLLSIWSDNELFLPDEIGQLRDSVLEADVRDWDSMLTKLSQYEERRTFVQSEQKDDDEKWVLPDRHGVVNDPTAPWHELPAANGLYLKRTRGYPLRSSALPPGGVYLKNGGREADPQLRRDVTNLHNEVVRCYDKYTNADEIQDIDALGNIIWKDPDRPTRNYWGFTLDGIDRKKELAQQFAQAANGYDEFGQRYGSAPRVNDAVERARALAAERGRGMGRGRNGMSRGGWRGGRNW